MLKSAKTKTADKDNEKALPHPFALKNNTQVLYGDLLKMKGNFVRRTSQQLETMSAISIQMTCHTEDA